MTVSENEKVLEGTEVAATPKKSPKKVTEEKAAPVVEEQPKAEEKKPAVSKKPAKKAAKGDQPLYINGRYVVEKQLKSKPAKGSKPYELSKNKIKITLVRSTNGCLDKQIKTIKALGLKKINQFVVVCDNDAIRGMIFKVKHLVTVEKA